MMCGVNIYFLLWTKLQRGEVIYGIFCVASYVEKEERKGEGHLSTLCLSSACS